MTLIVTTIQDTNSNVFQNVAVWCDVDVESAAGLMRLGESLNVSSLTDGGVGIYTTNFTNSFSADTYLFKITPGSDANNKFRYGVPNTPATGSSPWTTSVHDGTEADEPNNGNYAIGALA